MRNIAILHTIVLLGVFIFASCVENSNNNADYEVQKQQENYLTIQLSKEKISKLDRRYSEYIASGKNKNFTKLIDLTYPPAYEELLKLNSNLSMDEIKKEMAKEFLQDFEEGEKRG